MLLGSNNAQMALGVRFYLKDQFSTPVQRMTGALKGYRSEFSAFQENLRVARNVNAGIAAAGAIATRSMAQAVRSGSEFLYTMKGVEVISEGTAIQMEKVNKLAIALGRQTIFKPNEIASGMRFMAMAGQDAVTILKTITAATDLGQASMTPLGGKMGAADIMTNALKAFGWQAERSAEMADLLVTAVTNANVSLLDLGNSIRYAAATSRNLNIPVQETIGMLMALGNAGIQSSMAGTAIENMYRYLAQSMSSTATKKASGAWEKLGLTLKDITDSAGNFKPLVQVMKLMGDKMTKMSPIEVQNIFKEIFGVRGQRAGGTIARTLSDATSFVALLSDPALEGAAAQKGAAMMDTLKGSLNKLVSTLEGMHVAFTQAVEGPLRVMVDGLKNLLGLITRFIATPIGKFLSTMAAGFIVILTPIMAVRAAVIGLAFAMKSLMVTSAGMASSTRMMFGMLTGRAMMAPGMVASTAAAGQIRKYGAAPRILAKGERMGTTKSGATYIMGPGGKMRGRVKAGTPVASRVSSGVLKKIAYNTSKTARGLRLARGIGTGFMGLMGGPVGLAFTALAVGVPMLVDYLGKNSRAVAANTAALQSKLSDPVREQFYSLIQGRKVQEVLEIISNNMGIAIEEGRLDRQSLQELLTKENYGDFIQFLLSNRGAVQTIFQPIDG